uniref:uncharacterized protein LOC108950283 n=1 Tax=Ciona intestinalis TaxID=7719 RepID=UPI00089DBA87|nr:uncharacterized protein LOC108950283 [Ciona intestinalis]|eukprot:XP_018671145.1 uncharacterized protein LOC108950283 [Ciona intestinalis]
MRWLLNPSVIVALLHMIQYSSSQDNWCNKTLGRQFETVHFHWYKNYSTENCTWTFTPPTPEATCFMLSINRVKFRNQSLDSNLLYVLLPDNVKKINDSFGISNHSCRIYSKSVEYVYSPKSWAPSECNTTIVIEEWPPRIKMKIYNMRMLLNYAFLNCKNTTTTTSENESDQMSIKFTITFACAIAFGALLIIRFIYDCITFVRKRHSNTTTSLNQDDAEPEVSFKCPKQEAVYELADKCPDAELVDNVLYHQYGGDQDM